MSSACSAPATAFVSIASHSRINAANPEPVSTSPTRSARRASSSAAAPSSVSTRSASVSRRRVARVRSPSVSTGGDGRPTTPAAAGSAGARYARWRHRAPQYFAVARFASNASPHDAHVLCMTPPGGGQKSDMNAYQGPASRHFHEISMEVTQHGGDLHGFLGLPALGAPDPVRSSATPGGDGLPAATGSVELIAGRMDGADPSGAGVVVAEGPSTAGRDPSAGVDASPGRAVASLLAVRLAGGDEEG
jgi:hypothetical protein